MKNKMNRILIAGLIIIAALSSCKYFGPKQNSEGEPWTLQQLMEPAVLNNTINNPNAEKPLIYSIGFGGGIKGSVEMGAARDEVNLEKFKATLSTLPKNANIVIYCGCCPFEHCPNVRPAFKLLNDMGFTNHKLLNLKENFKVDWLDKGYAVIK